MQKQNESLNTLLKYYVAAAKPELDTTQAFDIHKLMLFLQLAGSYIPAQHLTDHKIIKYSIEKLVNHSVEAAVFHIFLLSVYKLSIDSEHPLERGVIKQKVLHAIPAFEKAMQAQLITKEMYNKNIDALITMAESSSELTALHQALTSEYERVEPC